MTQLKNPNKGDFKKHLPDPEDLANELASAKSIDDFCGKDGIFARLFSETVEQMLEAELTEELGYDRYEPEGRNSGNSRNGHYKRKMRTSEGDAEIKVPRDRNGEFQSELLKKNSNEIEVGDSNEVLGTIGIWKIDWMGSQAYEMGWSVLPEHQGKGVATESARLILSQARSDAEVNQTFQLPRWNDVTFSGKLSFLK